MGFRCCVLPGCPVAHAIFNFPDGFVARLRPFGMGNQACLVGVSNLTPGWECPVGARLLSTGSSSRNDSGADGMQESTERSSELSREHDETARQMCAREEEQGSSI